MKYLTWRSQNQKNLNVFSCQPSAISFYFQQLKCPDKPGLNADR
jgi:hypothetical protein